MTSSPTSRRRSKRRPDYLRFIGLLALASVRLVTADDDVRPCAFATFDYALVGEEALAGTPGASLDGKETQLAAGLGCFGRPDRRFDVAFDYQYTRYLYDGIDSRNRDLHRAQVPIGLRAAGDRWSVDAHFAPGIAISSNILKKLADRLSSDDVFATARIEASSAANAAGSLVVGGAWDRAFGRPRIYPVVGIDYRPSARLATRIAFPDSAVRFAATDRQAITLRLYPAGFEWHVLEDDLVSEFDYRVEAWRAEAWWSIATPGKTFLDLSIGYEFARRHEFTDRAGTTIAQDVDDAVTIAIGLRWHDGPLLQTHRIAR